MTGVLAHVLVDAQSVSINKNVMAGVQDQFIGDMHRQRQNENTVCVFSNNPVIQIHAFNDYRTVDDPLDSQVGTPGPIQRSVGARIFDFLRGRSPKQQPATLKASAQAWIGLSFSDNDKDFYTGLLPGSPFSPDMGNDGLGKPRDELKGYQFQAASDPVFAATPDKCLLAGIAFTPGGGSAGFVSRFTNKNNTETGRNTVFDFTKVLLLSQAKFFVDKPSIAAGPNGKVYAAFVLFDETDATKLSSKIVMFQSSDYGETWSTPGITLSQPLSRNQAPWIVVDPNNQNQVYVGWRVFSAQPGGLTNAVVGKRSSNGGLSFEPVVPYPVALLLKAYDQPRTEYIATATSPVPPIPRSNAYPTAVMDSHGALHLAMQEYVNPATGYPLAPWEPATSGIARITVSTSYNKGATWSLRRAIDYGPGSGPQFMPALAVTGRPGPACPGKAGPRSLLSLIYFDARASYPNGRVFFGGGDKQFDVRVAQADPCQPDAGGRPVFGQSQQVSQYTRLAEGSHPIVAVEGFDGSSPVRPYIPATNRAYRMFSGAKSAFAGDYLGNVPKVGFVLTPTANGNVWKPTTAADVNPATLPAPVFVAAWPDTRDVSLPTVPSPASPALKPIADPGYIDSLPFDNYAPPGLGLTASQCWNPGSRDQNPYSAEVHGGLFAAAPVTFRQSNIPRAYPVYVENRTALGRFFRITIDAAANAQFNVPGLNVAPIKTADVVIAPFSSVTGTVIINADVNVPVLVKIDEIQALAGIAVQDGLKTTVTINTVSVNAVSGTSETHQPAIDAAPTVTKPYGTTFPIQVGDRNPFVHTPFGQNAFGQTPFGQNPFGQNPFGQNPFGQNPFGQNPFGQNPFGQNPFGQNPTVYDVTDVSFTVTNGGTHVSSYSATAALQQAVATCTTADTKPCYMFQTIVNRISLVAGLNGCQVTETKTDNQVTQTAFVQTPFGQNPFGQNPFGQNPFGQNPFGQNESPNDPNLPSPVTSPSVSNSTFYLAPAVQPDVNAKLEGTPGVPGRSQMGFVRASATTGVVPALLPVTSGFRAARPNDEIVYTVRVFQMASSNVIPVASTFSPSKLTVAVSAHTPDFTGGVFVSGGGTTTAAGAAVATKLAFSVQPTTATAGAAMSPVTVTIQDVFGNAVTSSTLPVTLAIGTNPSNGALAGTTTQNAVNGVATFSNLSINNSGNGYTLLASSPGLAGSISNPFNVVASNAQTFLNTDVVSAGFGGMRGIGTGTITLTGVSGTVTKALLFWHGPTNSSNPAANATVRFKAEPVTGTNEPNVTGTNIGFAHNNNWGFANSQAYRADVTSLVSGNGSYLLENFRKTGEVTPVVADINGASLIVFFDDGNTTNNRDVYLFSTNDSNVLFGSELANWSDTLTGIVYGTGTATLQLHVGDGQGYGDGGVILNGTEVVAEGLNFQGNSVPNGPNPGGMPSGEGGGGLWDIKSWNIPPGVLNVGSNTVTLTSPTRVDALSLVVMMIVVDAVPPQVQ